MQRRRSAGGCLPRRRTMSRRRLRKTPTAPTEVGPATTSVPPGTMCACRPPPPPLVLIHGDERLLVDRAVRRIVARPAGSIPEWNAGKRPRPGMVPGEFADLVAPSLFAEPRLVVILRGAQEAAKELADALIGVYARTPSTGVTLVVHHAGGARNKALADAMRRPARRVLTCNKITKAAERLDFVRAEIRRAGGDHDPASGGRAGRRCGLRPSGAGRRRRPAGGGHRRAWWTRRRSGGTTAAGPRLPASRCPTRRWPATCRRAGGAALGVSAIGVAPVLIADALADGVRTVAKVSGARAGNSYALAGELGMPPWKIDGRGRGARLEPGWAGDRDGRRRGAERGCQGAARRPDYALEKAVIDLVAARGALTLTQSDNSTTATALGGRRRDRGSAPPLELTRTARPGIGRPAIGDSERVDLAAPAPTCGSRPGWGG